MTGENRPQMLTQLRRVRHAHHEFSVYINAAHGAGPGNLSNEITKQIQKQFTTETQRAQSFIC